jgi:hypothetical protein
MLQHHRRRDLRIICFCLNRDGGPTGRGSASNDKWSRDHAHLCDIEQSPPDLGAANSGGTSRAPRVSDADVARHMNALQPHIIVDLHGFMYAKLKLVSRALLLPLFHRLKFYFIFVLPPQCKCLDTSPCLCMPRALHFMRLYALVLCHIILFPFTASHSSGQATALEFSYFVLLHLK